MDATALTPEQVRELTNLRIRAYGPGGGIQPADLLRLGQLEDAARPSPPRPSSPDLPLPPVSRIAASREGEASVVRGVAPATDGREPAEGSTPRRRYRRWVVAAVAAVLATFAIVWGVTQVGGPRATTTLGPIPGDGDGRGDVRFGMLGMYGVDPTTVQQYESHHTLTTWGASAPNGQRCLVIYAGGYGPAGISCTPRGLDPTVDVRIYPGMPEEIVGGLSVGSVIRYVFSGDRVLVWQRVADDPA